MSEVLNTIEGQDTATHETIIHQRGHVQALAFARKGGAAFSQMLGGIAAAKAAERQGPIHVFAFFLNHFTEDERAAIPVPGSKKEATNNAYDKYTVTVETKDGKKQIPGSWFTDVVKASDAWDGWNSKLEELNGLGKTGERDLEKKTIKDAIQDARKALARGAMLWHHAEEISAINPAKIKVKMPIKAVPVLDADGKQIATQSEFKVYGNNIRLQDPSAEAEDIIFSISEFLALKPSKLVGKPEDATIGTLEATKAKVVVGDKNKGRDGKTKIAVPATVEQFLNFCNVGATALDNETDQGSKLNSLILTACSVPGEKGDDATETIGGFILAADAIWSVIQTRYDAIMLKKAKANAAQQLATAKAS